MFHQFIIRGVTEEQKREGNLHCDDFGELLYSQYQNLYLRISIFTGLVCTIISNQS